MSYSQIQTYPINAPSLGSSELEALAQLWKDKKANLEQSGSYQQFIRKLQREWAIETGIIERLYTWDRGVTLVLIEQGIDASIIAHHSGMNRQQAEDVKLIIDDQEEIVDGLFTFVKGEQPLTEHYVRSLQQKFTEHQDTTDALTSDGRIVKIPLLKGQYKQQPNNPKRTDGSVHYYCPPEITTDEMQRLVEWFNDPANAEHPIEVKAAWLHHRFTQIHPFQDGNGRVARALASLVFLKHGLFPLVIRDQERTEYIEALEKADAGDLHPLSKLFAQRQRDSILKAIGLQQQVEQSGHAAQIMQSALQLLKDKYSAAKVEVYKVYEFADTLMHQAHDQMRQLSNTLNPQLVAATPPGKQAYTSRSSCADKDSPNKHYFYREIIEMAQPHRFDYYANVDVYKSWCRLAIQSGIAFEYVISIHGFGYGETGVLTASAFSFQKIKDEDGMSQNIGLQPACIDLFQFNYSEKREDIEVRFNEWMEASVTMAFTHWRRLIAS